jgi:hypothetical protein
MFRTHSAHHQREHQCYYTKQLHNNTWSAVYVDLLVIIRVVMLPWKLKYEILVFVCL